MTQIFARFRRGLAVTAALILPTFSACASAEVAPTIAKVDGRPLAYRVLGSGRPVLVMISGLGDGMNSFQDVAAELSKTATVIIYDRTGYGGSAMAPGRHDAAAVDRDLSEVLKQTKVAGPYVLLGHSLGGLYAEYYAANHPDKVSGLILEESRPADFTRRCESAGVKMCVAPASMMVFSPAGAGAELAALPATSKEVEAVGPLQGKPVLVISRAIDAKSSPFDRIWSEDQDLLAARYIGACHLTASRSGHYVHRDQKAWFVTSVRDFITMNACAENDQGRP